MLPMNISLIQIIQQKDELLRKRWDSSVKALQSRIDLFQSDSAVFGEIHQLMISLISIVENKESAEQAVDAQLKPIVFRLRDLQSAHHLSATEMVFLLFLMRDTLQKMVHDPSIENLSQEKDSLSAIE